METITIEYDTASKQLPPDDIYYENEYQPEPWKIYGQSGGGIILIAVGETGWQLISSPQKLPGFGMWIDRTETDEELLAELGGNWSGFSIEP